MAKRNTRKKANEIIPPGATKQAIERDENPRGRPRHTPLDDREATGDNPDTGLPGPFEEDDFDEAGRPALRRPFRRSGGRHAGRGPRRGGETGGGIAPQRGKRDVDSTSARNRDAGERRPEGARPQRAPLRVAATVSGK